MNVLVFRTNIQNQRMIACLHPILNAHPIIIDWSVDTDDCDKVLRVETIGNLTESDIIHMVSDIGIACEALTD